MENLPPHVLRLVYKEVSALAADPPEGIKIYPSEEDITELHTAIEGPGKDCSMVSGQAVVGHDRTIKTCLATNFDFCIEAHTGVSIPEVRNGCMIRHLTLYSTQT